ncbi:hypothetical protein CRG98_040857, partial [Punica granatum]
MATSHQFCAVSGRAESFKLARCNSMSGLIDFGSSWKRKTKLLRIRTGNGLPPSRRSLSVRSGPKQKIEDPITADEDISSTLSPFTPDAASIASSIKYHAEFTPSFAPDQFELPKAFFATAQSVRDALIINWNETYDCCNKLNVKQAYYLSMEFLQERDAALGNGGLGRLASCFLDSLATLNYPAWGYGLRYKYGLFKQLITKDGQEEVAEDWLEMGNPWEIVRNDISYPIKFFGKVISESDGKKHWIGGEDIQAVAHDVPIPGYKTKTTINLRLWSTKVPSEDFDLSAFNAGEHTRANEALANAEKVCYVLYPGDDTEEGKILRLKQQYTLCSASLQDIIARFERRSGEKVKWEEFPEKVAVQMNDTHPTLCIPELMRILIDVKGLTWKEAWNVTQRTVAYTNHTVLPEALEKWSLELLEKLLPRHVEIIEMIDEELIRSIVAEYGTADPDILEKKLKEMRILENVDLPGQFADLVVKPKEVPNVAATAELEISEVTQHNDDEEAEIGKQPNDNEEAETGKRPNDDEEAETGNSMEQKSIELELEPEPEPEPEPPKMVRMANLCIVGGHAVNGVAEIHSEIVKNEVFNEFFKLWPEKFQNKTNGVTPRRWIRFCNPELSKIITNWTGTEDWILNMEKLAELRK